MLRQIEKLYIKYCPDFKPGAANRTIKIFRDDPSFKRVVLKQYPRTTSFTRSHYFKLIQTFSWVSSLKTEHKEILLKKIKIELSKYKEPLRIPGKTLLCMSKNK
jgi:hypothetical protein